MESETLMTSLRKPLHLAGLTETHVRIAYHIIRFHARGIEPTAENVLLIYGKAIDTLERNGLSNLSAYVHAYRMLYLEGVSTKAARVELLGRCSSARLWRQVVFPSYKRGR